jgi:hypothetical protein
MLQKARHLVNTRCSTPGVIGRIHASVYPPLSYHSNTLSWSSWRHWTSQPETKNGMPSIVPPVPRRPSAPISVNQQAAADADAANATQQTGETSTQQEGDEQPEGDIELSSGHAPMVIPASSARRSSRRAPISSLDMDTDATTPTAATAAETSASTNDEKQLARSPSPNWKQMLPAAYPLGTVDDLIASQRPSIPSSYGHHNLTISMSFSIFRYTQRISRV